MAKINDNKDLDINITILGRLVTEISVIYNNKFIKRLYVGLPYQKALAKFEKELKEGRL